MKLFRLGYAPDLVGRHGQLGQEQRPRTRAGGERRASILRKEERRPLLRPLSRTADVPHLRRAGPGDRLQRPGPVRAMRRRPSTSTRPRRRSSPRARSSSGSTNPSARVLDAGYAIVCEGQLDLIACFMAGVQERRRAAGHGFHRRPRPDPQALRGGGRALLRFGRSRAKRRRPVARSVCWPPAWPCASPWCPRRMIPDSFIKAFGGAAFKQLIDAGGGLLRLLPQSPVRDERSRRPTRGGWRCCAAWPRPCTKPATSS